MSTHKDLQAVPVAAGEVLESLYEHRLLSTRQIHRMHTPGSGIRWTREILTGLRRRGLVSFLRAADGAGSVYFLTSKGAHAVELIATRTLGRRKLITPAQAAGPLRTHTLAVNETGIAFMAAAREREDEFGALAWRHEIAHPIAGRRGELLIADALFTYLQYGCKGTLNFHYRLLELDRATLPTEMLAGKLARYARLYHYTRTGQKAPAWRACYPVFPGVICVLTGDITKALERRLQSVLALCSEDRELQQTPEVGISICLLDDLTAQGPFAAIWRRPGIEQRLGWLDTQPDEPKGNRGREG
ncbi:MAG TPA: replication-relaxation family protein [Solirubrobacteraceae bacterium]|nr:replication-relaxation family protein [Solirubrobacteraceae bacterium]